MNEWTEQKTMLEVAHAVERGDEIRFAGSGGAWRAWRPEKGDLWGSHMSFESRPKKKVKTIVLREALCCLNGEYSAQWVDDKYISGLSIFVKWLDTPAREIEVEL